MYWKRVIKNDELGVIDDFNKVKFWNKLLTVQADEYTPIKPFLGPNITMNTSINI